ncbi:MULTISPECIES: hypothetical protein [unclassified Amycolatopsis]|uniref:hypothetical protein n=1 Tax=unclassified Amycolatopsis TaxID=2618356 RepID=UPI00106DE930|nr:MULTISPECIES: hypothetical protein [unclassified Amycolatopsis]
MIAVATPNSAARRTTGGGLAEEGTILLDPLAREIAHRLGARNCRSAPRGSGRYGGRDAVDAAMIVIATPNSAARCTTAVAEAGALLLDPLAREVAHRLGSLRAPAIAQAHHGDRAAVVGATLLALP